MSVSGVATDKPVHMPRNPDKFEFDDEVARVFDNMALRSIPMYVEARKLTIALAAERIKKLLYKRMMVTVVDVGASTGAFFKDLWWALGVSPSQSLPNIRCIAVDSSEPMLSQLSTYLPKVETLSIDAMDVHNHIGNIDICNLAYVTQFLNPKKHHEFYYNIYNSMRDDGLLISSQKEYIDTRYAECFDNQYIQFRKDNGYTEEEIAAKTKALKNAMWPQTYYHTIGDLTEVGFKDIQEVCRWLQFSTVVATK